MLRCELQDALAKLQIVSVMPLPPELQVGSIDEGTECSFGEFSPRALHAMSSVPGGAVITEVVAPVVQTFPELQDHCGESCMVLPIERGSLESLTEDMAPSPPLSELCQPPPSMDSGGLVSSSSSSDQVDETALLAPSSEALFGKEVCDLLVDLEAACPGYGKDVASVLAGTASDGVLMKVKKSLGWRARNKLGFLSKASALS